MFGFDKPEDGSEERFHERMERWKTDVEIDLLRELRKGGQKIVHLGHLRELRPAQTKLLRSLSLVQHHLWWLFHNCVTHPLIGIAPIKPFFDLHDWTSHRLNHEEDDADKARH